MNARADAMSERSERRRALNWQTLVQPLVAALLVLIPASVAALITYGTQQNRIEQLEARTLRVERHQEEGQRSDILVLQRLATVEAKIDSLRELVVRERRAGSP